MTIERVDLTDALLLNASRPGRYIGSEHNIIIKEWAPHMISVCLCYPDVYEVGMSHLGLKILYHILNRRDDVLCERAFSPWMDMEELMRKRKIPLFSLENRISLSAFDIIGFSLQSELTYTNLINMLSLAGMPQRSADRKGAGYPLIIAGGPCAFNPEPLAAFIDLFLIGDGEDAISDIVDAFKHFKDLHHTRNGQAKFDKSGGELLEAMARIQGVYVPALYKGAGEDKRIEKRICTELRQDIYPTHPLVPYIATVHDRIVLEIMRGCLHQCRFCQARSIYQPVRVRKSEEIISLAKETYKNTGLDEISLVSLSSASYPAIDILIERLTQQFAPLGVGISLPSLRIEEDIERLPALIKLIRKSGLTFAPEVGTEKMLRVINKNIRFEQLFKALEAAYRMGWRRIKLYFMIGLPHEEESDLKAIIELAEKAAMLKKKVSRSAAEVVVSVSSFIPKPHTAFQWMRMAGADELLRKQTFLSKELKGKRYLTLKLHSIEMSIIEAIFSRGDRSLSDILVSAWAKGARYDAWGQSFNPGIWDEAFSECGVDKNKYLTQRDYQELLPWEHIGCGIPKQALIKEAQEALG